MASLVPLSVTVGQGGLQIEVTLRLAFFFSFFLAFVLLMLNPTILLRFHGLMVNHLVQALPSVQPLQSPTGRLDNDGNYAANNCGPPCLPQTINPF